MAAGLVIRSVTDSMAEVWKSLLIWQPYIFIMIVRIIYWDW